MTIKISPKTSASLILLFLYLIFASSLGYSRTYSNSELVAKSAICLDCHQDAADNLKGSKHQISTDSTKKSGMAVGCIGCHSGWEKHIEEPSKDNISTPLEMSLTQQNEVCASCHLGEHQVAMMTTDPHGRAQLECSSCHSIHGNKARGLVKDDSQNFCLTCHTDVKAQFVGSRSSHPLSSENIRCSDCHTMSNRRDAMVSKGLNWTCQNCHSEKSGPFVFEHPVTSEHLFNGSGCVECHNPHGSPNDRLLVQPGNGVCLQCHAIPPKHLTEHAGLGSKVPCVECHIDTHGSDNNSKFLDPQLNTKFYADCYHSGCHGNVR